MLQNLQNHAKFQKFQLDSLVDFEKCCKTHIFLQKSVPIQPKTSNILPNFCQKLATTLRGSFALRGSHSVHGDEVAVAEAGEEALLPRAVQEGPDRVAAELDARGYLGDL